MSISFNPYPTTGVPDGFVLSTGGYVQGTFLDDPATRYQLEGGTVSSSQSTPIWGGLPLTLAVADVGANLRGPSATVATTAAAINAWCLFNQASAGVITPSSNVPLYAAGNSLNFARPGSNLRIVLPVLNGTVLDALQGAAPTVDLYWDTVNNCLTNATGSGIIGPIAVLLEDLSDTSMIVTYSSETGFANWTSSSPAAVVRI